jgi:hypothetical protein
LLSLNSYTLTFFTLDLFPVDNGHVMRKEQHTKQNDAFALFPELMKDIVVSSPPEKKRKKAPKPVEEEVKGRVAKAPKNHVRPPPPPDLSYLKEGILEEEKTGDIPTVLVLMENGQDKQGLSSDFQALGYQIELADSPDQAIEKLAFTSFAAIVMHAEFGRKSLSDSSVHNYLKWLPTSKRRTIFYILVGPDFRTLYDLEALSLSANLVINDSDVKYLKPILRKSFREHEVLFGPLMETLGLYGKE